MKKQKQDIIDQSLKIIFNEGLRSFTVDRLSSIIRISKKTIYSIFATKEILIDKIIQYKLLSIDKEIETILNKNKCPIKSFYEINQLHKELGKYVSKKYIDEDIFDFTYDEKYLEYLEQLKKVNLYLDSLKKAIK